MSYLMILMEVTDTFVFLTEELPHSLEIEYPQINNKPSRIVKPRTEAKIAAKENKKALISKGSCYSKSFDDKGDAEGFVTVGRKNKPVGNNNGE
ncbi:hypothetical protein Tco_1361923 [Tanacetum coccineum]